MLAKLFKQHPERLKGPILIPLAFVMLILLAVSLFGVSWVQKLHIRHGVISHLTSVKQLFTGMQDEEAKLINSLLDTYTINPDLQKAFLTHDRAILQNIAKPIFKTIHDRYDITHFYFLKPDKSCFLRVHNPKRHSDTITRRTLEEAISTQKPSYGIELGPYGTLTLRVVHPWFINGKVMGYVEMGKEIENITREIKKILNVELFLIVNTRHLNRERWEEGLRILGRKGQWEEFPRHVVIDRTSEDVPKQLAPFIKLSHEEKEGRLLKVRIGKLDFRGGFLPLREKNENEIGEIIFLKDFTEAEQSLSLLTLIIVAISFSMAIILFIFFFIFIKRIEGRLIKSHKSLNAEIAERTKAEEQIKASLHEKELLLREIHHRVKNNMQIVSSLFRLQLRQIDDPKVLKILQESQGRIHAMALVHESLYQPQNLTNVNFRDYIRELCINLFGSYCVDPERVKFITDVEKITMDIDTAIPCSLIINEIVTNSLKHAFPGDRSGTIWLTLNHDIEVNEYTLVIRDDGIGMPTDVDIYNTKTLGMQLVVNLVEKQLQGDIEVHRNNGTKFVVKFKKTAYVKRI